MKKFIFLLISLIAFKDINIQAVSKNDQIAIALGTILPVVALTAVIATYYGLKPKGTLTQEQFDNLQVTTKNIQRNELRQNLDQQDLYNAIKYSNEDLLVELKNENLPSFEPIYQAIDDYSKHLDSLDFTKAISPVDLNKLDTLSKNVDFLVEQAYKNSPIQNEIELINPAVQETIASVQIEIPTTTAETSLASRALPEIPKNVPAPNPRLTPEEITSLKDLAISPATDTTTVTSGLTDITGTPIDTGAPGGPSISNEPVAIPEIPESTPVADTAVTMADAFAGA